MLSDRNTPARRQVLVETEDHHHNREWEDQDQDQEARECTLTIHEDKEVRDHHQICRTEVLQTKWASSIQEVKVDQ